MSGVDSLVDRTIMDRYRVEALLGRGGMCAVYRALDLKERQGVAHRDVKPENVFLIGAPPTETAKLLDFGIASNDNAVDKLTATGVAFGTPEYISPEMALGLPTDARSDLYSVGVMLFQMLTG